jgi:hypothetical protein
MFIFMVPQIRFGLESIAYARTGEDLSGPWVACLFLAGNLLSQLVCVSGVNQLSSVSFRIFYGVLSPEFGRAARFLSLNSSGLDRTQSVEPLRECMVVPQRVERTACGWRNYGISRLDVVRAESTRTGSFATVRR